MWYVVGFERPTFSLTIGVGVFYLVLRSRPPRGLNHARGDNLESGALIGVSFFLLLLVKDLSAAPKGDIRGSGGCRLLFVLWGCGIDFSARFAFGTRLRLLYFTSFRGVRTSSSAKGVRNLRLLG